MLIHLNLTKSYPNCLPRKEKYIIIYNILHETGYFLDEFSPALPTPQKLNFMNRAWIIKLKSD